MTTGRLLVIDDDPAIGQTICAIARTAGVEARATVDPDAFFAAIDSFQPTHIAVDLVMPQMDGVELMMALAQRQCRARIIITSGLGSRVLDAAGRSAAEHGLDIAGILSKPFSPASLRKLLADEAPALSGGAASVPPAARPAAPDQRIDVEELRTAIEAHQLYPVYQPKVWCAGGALAGFEVLVRWSHPQRGELMPDLFVPLAEREGLIDTMSILVIETALPWFARTFGDTDATLAINMSARTASGAAGLSLDSDGDGGESSFFGRVLGLCAGLRLAPERIILELTESSAMEDPVASLNLITRLRMRGFQLSLDDFGTGFSSMLQLVRLPFSEIKVDKSFVMTLGQSQESRAVVRSIVDLGRSLGMRSSAEGVEDAAAMAYLEEIGCDLAQGYYVARPMRAEAAAEWARARAPTA